MDIASLVPGHVDHTNVHFQATIHPSQEAGGLSSTIMMTDAEDARAIYMQLYWLCLNGLVNVETTFALEPAPFGSDARFRINYRITRQFGRHRAQVLARFKLTTPYNNIHQTTCFNDNDNDNDDTPSRKTRGSRASTNDGICMSIIPPSQAAQYVATFTAAAHAIQHQWQLPISSEQALNNNNSMAKFGVGGWFELCDRLTYTQLQTFDSGVCEFVRRNSVDLQKHFDLHTYVQWTSVAPMLPEVICLDEDDDDDDDGSVVTTTSRKRKCHFETYAPEAKRRFCCDTNLVTVMPSSISGGGLGVFATIDITAGTTLTQYCGVVAVASIQKPFADQDSFGETHLLALGYGHSSPVADGLRYPLPHRGVGSLINSSRTQRNAEFKIRAVCGGLYKQASVVAKRPLKAGEEIFVDYLVI